MITGLVLACSDEVGLMSEDSDQKRLGAKVRARRLHLRLNQDELQALGGPSDTTVSDIENGKFSYLQLRTKQGLEKSLGWPDGAIDRILGGYEPDMGIFGPSMSWENFQQRLRRPIREAAVRRSEITAKIAAGQPLTPAEQSFVQRLTEENELSTLEARIEELPRDGKLKLSVRVDELRVEYAEQIEASYLAEPGDPDFGRKGGEEHGGSAPTRTAGDEPAAVISFPGRSVEFDPLKHAAETGEPTPDEQESPSDEESQSGPEGEDDNQDDGS